MTLTAFVTGLAGLVLAAMSLGWQIASWLLSGGRVKAKLRHGVIGWNGTAAVVGDVQRDGKPNDIAPVRAQGGNGPEVLALEVANVGRAAVTITSYEARLKGTGTAFGPIRDHMGPQLPHRLQPGERATWYIEMQSVRALVHAGQVIAKGAREVDMAVTLGTGKRVATPTRIIVA
ncbi:phosphoribosylamine--glycine ligase [Prauserella sp. PE36]|uniref:phosphoribosylamine--glycine ligase n=1 Tax=Prauserella sp. PE36 TaxID=1504709 RepID=UPI000DE4D245|nr:phosphoribosylamine--glycine ligase [Prauserella sp. PE36]RBM16595.1 phosphoribosylamine--glycine ligase [Prauserella sp. PE36]